MISTNNRWMCVSVTNQLVTGTANFNTRSSPNTTLRRKKLKVKAKSLMILMTASRPLASKI